MIFVIACGDNSTGGVADGGSDDGDDAARPDASPVQCDAPATGAPGSACAEDTECDSAQATGDGRCLIGEKRDTDFPDTGYCIRICDEDATDCGGGTVCIRQASFPMAICVAACCEGSVCAEGYACSTSIAGEDVGGAACLPGDPGAADGTPCTSIAECAANSQCAHEPGETDGLCTSVGSD
jgi:hypothetical protein